ncbi:MAG: ribonucleotide-diphosphate reductase subunit beta, partial [Bacteroidota bacterium]
ANEREVVKKSLLAIAQIEVAVKSFWGDLYHHFPKPEFNGLGSTFAECEFRHSEAYSRLLEVLGYNSEFAHLVEVPVIRKRIQYLSEALAHTKSTDRKKYVFSLILFSILIENVSLFSQFAIILSFSRFGGVMKNVSNIIAWTSVDEQVHANAGIFIVNKIREEFPDFFDEVTVAELRDIVADSIKVEAEILDWIFTGGEIANISKENLLNFMKYRVDDSMEKIGLEKIFFVSEFDYRPMVWFEEEVFANSLDDFFAKRPVEYTKHDKSITADDLF